MKNSSDLLESPMVTCDVAEWPAGLLKGETMVSLAGIGGFMHQRPSEDYNIHITYKLFL